MMLYKRKSVEKRINMKSKTKKVVRTQYSSVCERCTRKKTSTLKIACKHYCLSCKLWLCLNCMHRHCVFDHKVEKLVHQRDGTKKYVRMNCHAQKKRATNRLLNAIVEHDLTDQSAEDCAAFFGTTLEEVSVDGRFSLSDDESSDDSEEKTWVDEIQPEHPAAKFYM